MTIKYSYLLFLLTLFLSSSCYRMPTDQDFSVIPNTNNPDITCERMDTLLPQASY